MHFLTCSSSSSMRFVCLQWIYGIFLHETVFLKCCAAAHMSVDPPSSLEIYDPGFLGMLDIVWKAPYLKDFHGDCTVLYELRYQNGAGNRWRSIRTQHYKHRAAFNLSNGIFVKIRTLLKGSCTNEPQMWSDWIDTNYSAPVQGTVESQIQNFQCTYYNWKALQCVWKPGKLNDFSSNYELHYWHKGLPQNMSCSSYLRSDGKNTGCIFQSQDLEHYTDFFVCISGTSDSYLVRPSYFVFQLQDIVKPAPPKELSITTTNPNEIVLEWKLPEEIIPLRCLKFEIRYKEQDNIWKDTSEVQQTMSIIRKSNTSHIFCARVRDKVNQFCADDGFWSEWSPEVCWEEAPFEYKYVYIFGGCFTVLGACMTAGIFAVRTKRQCSKKLQQKAKKLVYEMDGSVGLNI